MELLSLARLARLALRPQDLGLLRETNQSVGPFEWGAV